jgi:hypothetical protein
MHWSDGNLHALAAHHDRHFVGVEPGDECNRLDVPDEDAPRNYRPRPCLGMMTEEDGEIVCDRCGEVA